MTSTNSLYVPCTVSSYEWMDCIYDGFGTVTTTANGIAVLIRCCSQHCCMFCPVPSCAWIAAYLSSLGADWHICPDGVFESLHDDDGNPEMDYFHGSFLSDLDGVTWWPDERMIKTRRFVVRGVDTLRSSWHVFYNLVYYAPNCLHLTVMTGRASLDDYLTLETEAFLPKHLHLLFPFAYSSVEIIDALHRLLDNRQ